MLLSYLRTIFSSRKLHEAPLDRCTKYTNEETARTIEDNNRGLNESGDPATVEGRRRDDVDGSALLSENSDALVFIHNDFSGNFYIPQASTSQGPGGADKKRTPFFPYRSATELAMPSILILVISGYCQNISLLLPVLDVIPDYLSLRDAYAESELRETYGIEAKWKTESADHVRSRLLQKIKMLHENRMQEHSGVKASKSHASADE